MLAIHFPRIHSLSPGNTLHLPRIHFLFPESKMLSWDKGRPQLKRIDFFRALPQFPPPPPLPPIRASCKTFFGRLKRRLARISEPRNDDYDNDVSDNCDHNLGTFDDFGVKNDQKVSHNMIMMSKYKGQHGGKKG